MNALSNTNVKEVQSPDKKILDRYVFDFGPRCLSVRS